jgi:hypothetical protein
MPPAAAPDAELLAACAVHAAADDRLRALQREQAERKTPADDPGALLREDAIDDALGDVEEALDWIGRLVPATKAGMAAKAGALRRNFRCLMVDPDLERAEDDDALGPDDRLLLTFLEQVAGGVA